MFIVETAPALSRSLSSDSNSVLDAPITPTDVMDSYLTYHGTMLDNINLPIPKNILVCPSSPMNPREQRRKRSARQYSVLEDLNDLMHTANFGLVVSDRATQGLLPLLRQMTFSRESVNLVEFGACPGRPALILPSLVSEINAQQIGVPHHDLFTFNITHADNHNLAVSEPVYEASLGNPSWQAAQRPSLAGRVYSYSASRPGNEPMLPPDTIDIGLSLLDLQWCREKFTAEAQLSSFLVGRSKELKPGALLLFAYPQQGELPTHALQETWSTPNTKSLRQSNNARPHVRPMLRMRSQSTPAGVTIPHSPGDLWQEMKDVIGVCIQRLVSCRLITCDLACKMAILPWHIRTAAQTNVVLSHAANDWELLWSAGLQLFSSEQVLHMVHPASEALLAGLLTPTAYAQQVVAFCRNIYEGHVTFVLKEVGGLGNAACSAVLALLWSTLAEKVEEGALQTIEMDIVMYVLRKR